MPDYPAPCESIRHMGRAIPAVDKYTQPETNHRMLLCARCSTRLGFTLVQKGWKYKRITNDQTPHQPGRDI